MFWHRPDRPVRRPRPLVGFLQFAAVVAVLVFAALLLA
jgi:hypothetical protein